MTTSVSRPAGPSSPAGRTHFARGHRTVRYRADTGFEAKCMYCSEWWPLTLEYWLPRGGMQRCAACWALYHRLHEAGRRADELVVEAKRAANKARYYADRERRLAYNREYKARNRERLREYNREYRVKNRQRLLDESRAYYAEARPVLLAKKRQAYAERAA